MSNPVFITSLTIGRLKPVISFENLGAFETDKKLKFFLLADR
jgi:hypothetical protein